jgi:hypothetical protein
MRILRSLSDGKPHSHRDIVKLTGLKDGQISACLRRCWHKGSILRSEHPIRKTNRVLKGRAGVRINLRSYYLYVRNPKGSPGDIEVGNAHFVFYRQSLLGVRSRSKARMVFEYLKEHPDTAFFSKDVVDALTDSGVRISDVMSNTRRYERQGLVYVRGYRTHDRQTPFKEGYLLTWIDSNLPREDAIAGAVKRTDTALEGRAATSPTIERVYRIRDMILAATKTRDIVAQSYVARELGCSDHELETAIRRTLQLYPDLKELKLFNNYRYFYHASMSPEDLQAAIAMKENYIRIEKGRDNRIGHNWEAAVEWFVDKFTTGASFREQPHRTAGMDPRRITLHLIRSVGGRRFNAEVDRVWIVTPGLFSPPTTYVLECKWGLVRKRDVDDFLSVLRWSKDFGVDTPEGRQLKQGVTGVFAGTAFKPDEKVLVNGQTISLGTYANRLNISLLKAADFNEKLHERGCKRDMTIQKVCSAAKDEDEIQEVLEGMWREPAEADKILTDVLRKNEKVYQFEKMLEEASKSPLQSPAVPSLT